jgi:ATPase subunit of ABC transporter with duplicated ATPase domains
VTHDRWFLDALATLTWEVADGAVHAYDGGYAAYVLAKAERARVAAVTEERRANLLRKELAWLRRGPPARTSKPRFRIDAANALIEDEPPPRDGVSLVRFATRRLGKDVVDLLDATVRVGDRQLLDRVTWRLAPGERVGIVGVNGSGKSTLLQAISGERALDGGRRAQGRTVSLAHLTQEVRELEPLAAYRVIEAIEDVARVMTLGDREVTGGRQQTRVGDLSGGERRRLQILRLLMAEPNVLLLDEPTNDLDIDTLTSLEDVLDGWAGTLVVVSHDRYLLERVCDRQVALLGDGRVRDLPGGVDEYLRLRRAVAGVTPGRYAAAPPERATPAGDSGPSAAQLREARKELARVERALSRLAERESRLHEQLAARASDHQAVLVLDAELRALVAERAELEDAWLAAAEFVE